MLGKGYEAWHTGAEEAITSSSKIATVLTNVAKDKDYDHVAFTQKHFDKNWTGNKMQLSADGPTLPIILVASDVFPMEAADIKKEFLAQPQSSVVHPSFNTITIQHPGKLGRGGGQKGCGQAHAPLPLRNRGHEFGQRRQHHICLSGAGNADSDGWPSLGPISCPVRPTQADIHHDPGLDPNDIRSREMSMTHVSKEMASHLLLGNLSTNGVTDAHNEANAVDPSALLPQRNLTLVE